MTTLDTLCVRFEAEAGDLFNSLDSIESRIAALREGGDTAATLPAEIEMRLCVAADEAISSALRGAGDTLSDAVAGHEVQLGASLAAAQQAMAAALQSAVNRLSASFNVTVPVYIDSTRVANAALGKIKQRLLSSGRSLA